MKKVLLFTSLSLATSLALSGCGGGGSSSADSTSSASFPTNAVIAEATVENGQEVEEVVTSNQQSTYTVNSINSNNRNENSALTFKRINDVINKNVEFNVYSLNETINETENCTYSGNINYYAVGDEVNGGTVTMTFNNCEEYDSTMNGKIVSTISNYNATYDDFTKMTMNFATDFNMSIYGETSTIKQGSNVSLEFSEITGFYTANKLKMNISSITTYNNETYGQQNATYFFDLSNYSQTKMYQTSGKIYINNLSSYAEYDTSYDMSVTPFTFDYNGNLLSGEARYIMANDGKLKISVESTNNSVVYIDADNDGTYELSENL